MAETVTDSNLVQLSYAIESEFGVSPAAAFQILRHTGESLKQDTSVIVSKEIRSDRQRSGIVRETIGASGNISFDLSYGSYDNLLMAALMASAWVTAVDISGTDIQAIASGNKIQSATDDKFLTLVAGQWIKISGFTTPGNNGYAKIVSITHSDSPTTENNILTLAGITLADEAAGDTVAIKQGAYIENGVTKYSITFERKYTEISKLSLFTGCMIDGFNIGFDQGFINGGFDILGTIEDSPAATTSTSYTAATTTLPQSAVDNVTAIFENGAVATFKLLAFNAALKNNLRQRRYVGQVAPFSMGTGAIDLTGSARIWFEDSTLFDKYTDFTATSLAVRFTDAAGNTYIVEIPEVHFTAADRPAASENTDIVQNFNWTATMDPTEEKTITIARFPIA